jgi:hypothetical protein
VYVTLGEGGGMVDFGCIAWVLGSLDSASLSFFGKMLLYLAPAGERAACGCGVATNAGDVGYR